VGSLFATWNASVTSFPVMPSSDGYPSQPELHGLICRHVKTRRHSADSTMSTRASSTATWTHAELLSVDVSAICENASAVTVIT
jgi:hypothetical protein